MTSAQGEIVGRERLFGPDDLAAVRIARSPPFGETGDEVESTAAFVRRRGTAQVRGGAAAVRHLADQAAGEQQPDVDVVGAVADRVGDQLADDQFGGETQLGQAPYGEPVGHLGPDPGDRGRVEIHRPLGHVLRVQATGTGDEQCDIVTRIRR